MNSHSSRLAFLQQLPEVRRDTVVIAVCQRVLGIIILTTSLFNSAVHAAADYSLAKAGVRQQLEQALSLATSQNQKSQSLAKQIIENGLQNNDTVTQIYGEISLAQAFEASGEIDTAGQHYLNAMRLEKTTEGTNDHNICFFLADGLRIVKHYDEAQTYITRGIALRRAIADEPYLVHAYDLQSSIYYLQRHYRSAIASSQASLAIAERINAPEFQLRANRKIAQSSRKTGNNQASLAHNLKALALVREQKNPRDIARYQEYVATDQRALGMYSASIENAKSALAVQRQYHDNYRISNLLLNLSIVYMKLSSYDQSLDYALEMLELNNLKAVASGHSQARLNTPVDTEQTRIQHESQHNNQIAAATNQLGRIMSRLKRDQEAEQYHQQTLALDPDTIKASYRASALRSLAKLSLRQNDQQTALRYTEQARKIYQQLQDSRGETTVDNTSADIYQKMGNYEQALHFHNRAIQRSIKLGDKWTQARAHISKGEILIALDTKRALDQLNIGLSIAKKLKAKSLMLQANQYLMKAEKKRGEFSRALKYYDAAFKLANENNNDELHNRIAELKVVHEMEKNEQQIDDLNHRMMISQLEISKQTAELEILNNKNIISSLKFEQQQTKLIFFVGVSIIVALLLAFLYMRYRYLQNAQQILNERNSEISEKNASLAELNHTKDRFFSIISHDLRGPVAAVVARSDMLSECFDEISKEQMRQYVNDILSAADQTYRLLENLLTWASVQLRNAAPLLALHYAKEVCDAVINELESLSNTKNISVNNAIGENHTFFADKNMITTVIRNILANAIKFTPQDGHISIYCDYSEDTITIHIKDSGVGIEPSDIDRLFRIDDMVSKTGTNGETGTGLGLALSKELIEKNLGELFIESEINNGSDFFFVLPNSPAEPTAPTK